MITNWSNNKHLRFTGFCASEQPCVGKDAAAVRMSVYAPKSLSGFYPGSEKVQGHTAIIQGQETLDCNNLKS